MFCFISEVRDINKLCLKNIYFWRFEKKIIDKPVEFGHCFGYISEHNGSLNNWIAHFCVTKVTKLLWIFKKITIFVKIFLKIFKKYIKLAIFENFNMIF